MTRPDEARAGIYDKMAASHEKLRRGLVYCLQCGTVQGVNSVECLRSGWPKCCGYTMSLDSPAERAALKAIRP